MIFARQKFSHKDKELLYDNVSKIKFIFSK